MAIKKLRISLDIPITDILALYATRNESVSIDVIGDDKAPKIPKQLRSGSQQIAGLLEGPKRKHAAGKAEDGRSVTIQETIAIVVLANPGQSVSTHDFKQRLT